MIRKGVVLNFKERTFADRDNKEGKKLKEKVLDYGEAHNKKQKVVGQQAREGTSGGDATLSTLNINIYNLWVEVSHEVSKDFEKVVGENEDGEECG